MATITNTIGTAGGRDYSTITAWAAALPASAVTAGNSYVGQLFNDSVFTDTAVSISTTTDASHTITLTTGAAQSFRDNAGAATNALFYNASNGAAWKHTNHYDTTISVTSADFTFSYMQVWNFDSASFDMFSSARGVIDSCIFEVNRGGVNIGGGKIVNTLITDTSGGGSGSGSRSLQGQGAHVVNCTLINLGTGDEPVLGAYGNPLLINNAFFSYPTAPVSCSSSSSNTCTSLASTVGTSNQVSKSISNQFVSATTDFRLKLGADCIHNGVVDTTDIPGSVDIIGQARGSQWDIGCWQFTSAAAGKLFLTAALSGLGSGGPFFSDRLT